MTKHNQPLTEDKVYYIALHEFLMYYSNQTGLTRLRQLNKVPTNCTLIDRILHKCGLLHLPNNVYIVKASQLHAPRYFTTQGSMCSHYYAIAVTEWELMHHYTIHFIVPNS